MRLIDSHGHVQSDQFDPDRDATLTAAQAAGVERLLVPGWDLASSRAAIGVAEWSAWPDAAVGIHPHEAARATDEVWAGIVGLAQHPRVLAIGETGLDYDRVFSPIPDQLANLRRHLALALELGKPAILHVRSAAGRRDAQDAMLAELRAAGFGGPASVGAFGDRPPALIHSYSGPVDYARAVLDLGLAISISGLAFRAGEEATAEAVSLVPPDRLLVETDSPFLAAPGGPKRRNAPEWVWLTAAWVAQRRGINPDRLGDDLVAAYDRTFRRAG
ncbi:MAG TPA: TatD family hydrolase [Candidatus Limnocylindrales bacterium]